MQRGTPSGTATSAAPSSGTSLQPSRRAARAGYSAVRSGDDVKIALSTSSGWKPFACWSPRNSSAVASRIAGPVFAAAVVAPRSPRRVLLMALVDQLRLMVITDSGLLKERDPVEACRQAAAGGASIIQVRLKDAPPDEVVALARALVGALAVPVIVNDRVDVALGAEGFGRLAQLAPAGTPVIGIGGVTVANAPTLVRAGAVGVAVIGAVWGAPDPAAATRALRAAIA